MEELHKVAAAISEEVGDRVNSEEILLSSYRSLMNDLRSLCESDRSSAEVRRLAGTFEKVITGRLRRAERRAEMGCVSTGDGSSGEKRLSFGQFRGCTFEEVLSQSPWYCQWAMNMRSPTGGLRAFVSWLKGSHGTLDEGHALGSDGAVVPCERCGEAVLFNYYLRHLTFFCPKSPDGPASAASSSMSATSSSTPAVRCPAACKCPICSEPYTPLATLAPCGHQICHHCAIAAAKCPFCRASVVSVVKKIFVA